MRALRLFSFLVPPGSSPSIRPVSDHSISWLLFWLFWSFLISAIYWILGPDSYMRVQDTMDFNISSRIAAARDLLAHGLTYWQPRFSTGMPALVHPTADSFLINGLPYLFFPAWMVYGFLMGLQRFLAGYFTFRLCRDVLKFDPVAALFSGLAFSLYLWSVQDIRIFEELGLPAVALTFLLMERLLSRSGSVAFPGAFLLGVLTALVAQSVLYTFFLVGALPFWFLIARGCSWRILWLPLSAFALGAVLAEAPQLLALLTYSPFTSRGQGGGGGESLPLPSLMQLTRHAWEVIGWQTHPQNGLYHGLFLLGVLVNRAPKGWAWRLLALYLLSGVGAEAGYALQHLLARWIPTSRGNLLDFNQFTIFLGPLLGGAGLHLARSATPRPGRAVVRVIVGCTALALLLPVANWMEVTRLLMHRLSTDRFANHFEHPVMKRLAALATPESPPFRVATVGTWPPTVASASGGGLYPAVVHAYGLESVDGYYRLHSARYHRFWQQVIAKALDAYPEQRERSVKWYYLFRPPEPRFAARAPWNPASLFDLELLSLANTRFLISQWPLDHPDLVLWHDPREALMQGRRWEALRLREKMLGAIRGEMPYNALYVYENRRVFPRLFLP
ncbi:MAG: hypothetical protein HQM00_15440, partial [Magnetococcales bacterium]|nr:hypothetical protein [Magnetococcales bacterium]